MRRLHYSIRQGLCQRLKVQQNLISEIRSTNYPAARLQRAQSSRGRGIKREAFFVTPHPDPLPQGERGFVESPLQADGVLIISNEKPNCGLL